MRKQLRAWTENLETFVVEVISGERRGARAAMMRVFLLGSSKLYQVGVTIHRWLINVRIPKNRR